MSVHIFCASTYLLENNIVYTAYDIICQFSTISFYVLTISPVIILELLRLFMYTFLRDHAIRSPKPIATAFRVLLCGQET